MLRVPVTMRLPRMWIAPPVAPFFTLWQSAKCISAEDWMKASSPNQKHPCKDPEPFTKSLPSKRAVFENCSGTLRSSVAPWWRVVSKMIHDHVKTTNLSSYQTCNGSRLAEWIYTRAELIFAVAFFFHAKASCTIST